jgi:hypothetical protein
MQFNREAIKVVNEIVLNMEDIFHIFKEGGEICPNITGRDFEFPITTNADEFNSNDGTDLLSIRDGNLVITLNIDSQREIMDYEREVRAKAKAEPEITADCNYEAN